MSKPIDTRSELLFCYDITDANPNGDPLDENKPRIDEETSINYVTDVRLKRTIRDYLFTCKGYDGSDGKDIFVREKASKKGGLQDGIERALDFSNKADGILAQCIDIRLFGGVIPLSKDSLTFTGPVQFKMGHSLNRVVLKHVQGSGAFASKAGKENKTFREEYFVPYSFIAFHGIVNQYAAQHTLLNDEDVQLLLEGLWLGTQNLISRSKFGQQPRFLLKIDYAEGHYFLGDLDHKIAMKCENDFKVRSLADFSLDITALLDAIQENGKHIKQVHFMRDANLVLTPDLPKEWHAIKF